MKLALIDDWRTHLKHAWSLRLMAVGAGPADIAAVEVRAAAEIGGQQLHLAAEDPVDHP